MTIEEMLEEEEGFVPHAYQDSLGFWTIGHGRMIDKKRRGGITKEEAKYLLQNDILKVSMQLYSTFPWVYYLDEVRKKVLLDMTYNMGIGTLTTFKNTLRAVNEHRWDDAANGMLASKWHRQVGRRARRLALMMRTGVDVRLGEVE